MNATPHKHAELIKQWADAPEWWDVYCSQPIVSTSIVNTPNPDWNATLVYELRKSAKHPDNIKPKKKLIDWSRMPRGTMTNFGEFLRVPEGITGTKYFSVMNSNFYVINIMKEEVRLAEQTQFTYWGGGECPVPEGVVVEVVFRDGDKTPDLADDFTWEHVKNSGDIIAYRILKLADNFTDNPSEAEE
jgi:hypothetical protein